MSARSKPWTSVKHQSNKDPSSIYAAPPVPQDSSLGSSFGPTVEMIVALAACSEFDTAVMVAFDSHQLLQASEQASFDEESLCAPSRFNLGIQADLGSQ